MGIDVVLGGLAGATDKEAGRSAENENGGLAGVNVAEIEKEGIEESDGDDGDEVVLAGANGREAIILAESGGDKTQPVCIDEVVDAVHGRFSVEFSTGGTFSFCVCCFLVVNIDLAPLLLLLW